MRRITIAMIVPLLFAALTFADTGTSNCKDIDGQFAGKLTENRLVSGSLTGDLVGRLEMSLDPAPLPDGARRGHSRIETGDGTIETADQVTMIASGADTMEVKVRFRIVRGDGAFRNMNGSFEAKGELRRSTGEIKFDYFGRLCQGR